ERFWLRRLAATRGERSRYEQLVVAERDGEVCGWLTAKIDDDVDKRLYSKPGAAVDDAVTDALLCHLLDLSAERGVLMIADGSPGSVYGRRVGALGQPIELYAGYYTRTPDPLALLDVLRPALTARLQASERYADASGSLEMSLYNSGIAIDYEHG